MAKTERSLSDYPREYPRKYGYDSIEKLYEACQEKFDEAKGRGHIPAKDKSAFRITKRETGEILGEYARGKEFDLAAMDILGKEDPELYRATIVSAPIARAFDNTQSHHLGQINWDDLFWKLVGRKEEFGRPGRKENSGCLEEVGYDVTERVKGEIDANVFNRAKSNSVYIFELDGIAYEASKAFVDAVRGMSQELKEYVELSDVWRQNPRRASAYRDLADHLVAKKFHKDPPSAFKYYIDNHVVVLPSEYTKDGKITIRDDIDGALPEGVPPLTVRPPTPSEENSDDVPPQGDETYRFRKERVHQTAFRKAILDAYVNMCCITGIDIKELLVASHIKPWKDSDKDEKTDPRNGLCLNALHDRAFDRGLIAIADDFTVMVSKKLALYKNKNNEAMRKMLLDYEGEKIKLPANSSKPLIELLKWHRKNVFEG